jgi:hypothetical protein
VDAHPPVAVLVPVALAAQPVGHGEVDLLAADQVELVAVRGVVAVQAPAAGGPVLQHDVVVHGGELPRLRVHLEALPVVAAGAGEDPLAEGRLGHLDALRGGTLPAGRGWRLGPERRGQEGQQQAQAPGQGMGADAEWRHGASFRMEPAGEQPDC